MKGYISRTKGMETTTSMFLLLISALLIFSILSQIDKENIGEGPLIDLRVYQARSLGETLMMYSNSSIEVPFLSVDHYSNNNSVFFWDGGTFVDLGSGGAATTDPIREVLKTTPDGLSTILLIGDIDVVDLCMAGEYISWTSSTSNGLFITIYLSIHAGSIELSEGSS